MVAGWGTDGGVHGKRNLLLMSFMAKLEFVKGKSAFSPCGEGWGEVGKSVDVSEHTPKAVGCQVKSR